MEISAKSRFDYGSVKALVHLEFSKKTAPKKQLILELVFCAVLAAAIVATMVVFEVGSSLFILLAVDFLLAAIFCMVYFVMPKSQYKALGKLQNTENFYTFCDDVLKICSKGQHYDGNAEVQYTMFVKVMETSEYFFLYQDRVQVFMIDKASIVGGTVEDIRGKLTSILGKKYIRCNY